MSSTALQKDTTLSHAGSRISPEFQDLLKFALD